ncbi:GGDEF domain-containing protein [Vibrio fluminensis]|uniref:GGDEF domain-containing protein n=1 Tax=Vibrio fluminensis TaxID=2783614 RepID=UPI001887AEDF|nr:GGDEF domain-containing protein [Vibrio fluminensis]
MSSLEQDIQSQLNRLQAQLEQTRLKQRDSSLKYKRELQVLQRVITSLSNACISNDPHLQSELFELKLAIEQQKDTTQLIPKLLVIERLIRQNSVAMDSHRQQLDSQVKHAGETLLRVVGLPAKIKRDLRDILSFDGINDTPQVEQVIKLLSIYERSVKILVANTNSTAAVLNNEADKELLKSIKNELQHLITELDFAGESGELLNDIRAKLLLGVSTHTLLEEILRVLKLVIQATHYERKTSQQFIEQVNSAISSSLKNSAQIADQSESYFSQRIEHSKALGTLVASSQQALEQADTLENAQKMLSPLLQQMDSLNQRLMHAEEREKSLLERMKFNHCQLEALQETTEEYRRRLDEQTERMQQDPLTRVLNRSAFTERLEVEYRRWIRSQHNLRVVQFDIDKFKTINDSFGYTAGDKALKIIARNIKSELRETDTIARFTGEEFIVLLPDRADAEALDLVKQIQQQISLLPFKFRDQQISITATAASTCFKDSDTPEEVIERLRSMQRQATTVGPEQIIWK